MLKNKFTTAAISVASVAFMAFVLGFSGSASASDCKLCSQLGRLGADFSKVADSKRAPRGSKARHDQEVKETAALIRGADLVIKILVDRNVDDEMMESVAMYLAVTAERDGLHLVMDSVLGEFNKSESQVIVKIRVALARLKAKKQISSREYELVEDSIATVLTAGQG